MKNNLFAKLPKELLLLITSIAIGLCIRIRAILNPASIDWDEDGFITLGKLLVRHGYLPFVATYEQKPPLSSVMYGIPFLFSENSAILVKLTSSLIVSISAFLVTSINTPRVPWSIRVMFCVASISFASLMPSGLGWMTEINSIFITSVLIYVFWKWTAGSRNDFLLGALIGAMPLFRTNLGIPAVILLAYILVICRGDKNVILRVFAGIVSVVSLTLIPYVLTNHASYFWKGMIGIHLNSMKAHEGFHFEFGKKQILILFISFLFMWLSRQSINKNVNEGLTSQSTYAFFKGASLLFVGTCISIALDQPNFAHHLLQIIPFPLLFIWLYLTESKPKIIWKSLLAWPLAVIMLITSTYLVYKKSDLIEKNYVREAAIEKCVESVVPPASKIWALNSIYLYWRENYVPASPLLIHPSTLLMPNFLQTFPKHPLSQSEALMSIIKSELDFVIRSKGPTYLTADLNLELNRELDEKFTENFACKHLRIEIYKRNSN